METQPNRQIYVVDLSFEIAEFTRFHMGYANRYTPKSRIDKYVEAMVEQMISHFEYQDQAVQSFLRHYTAMFTENQSMMWLYHPMRFLKQYLTQKECQGYLYCLYGFAERVYNQLVNSGLYTSQGRLIASFQHLRGNAFLHLIDRPEVPHDIFS